ncbi:hypothetical protein ANN_18993 [Periplaneta americana]|uniref:Reverse transcriptase domain-containing protein n=1 Tax=Periplaneta americana TaxID=6978 RepID=A0ABQ8SQA1_PERAM|nr:hypothetical protein ANN_18993 [Periplaneta americana]
MVAPHGQMEEQLKEEEFSFRERKVREMQLDATDNRRKISREEKGNYVVFVDLEKAFDRNMGEVIVRGIRIKCIRFADDMALLAEEEMILKDMLLELHDSCEQYGMRIIANKTKNIEHLLRTSGERIKRLVKCFVWSVALCGAEMWTLRQSEEKRIEAFEMWIWRTMERVKWTDRIRNEAVLERVGEEGMMLKLNRKRKMNWLGHWLRRNYLSKDALEGMVNGRRVRVPIIGEWPEDFKETVVQPISKKNNAKKCNEFRTISLVLYSVKILLRILNRRL